MKKLLIVAAILVALACLCYLAYLGWWHATHYTVERTEYSDTYTVERTDYSNPKQKDKLNLSDDLLDAKNPQFDPDLIDSRPLGDWQVNLSAAVIELDCPAVKPDLEPEMLVLRPSYADAVKAAEDAGLKLLPSANLLDGAAKQFDDGLYAAVDLTCFRDGFGNSPAATALVGNIFKKLPADSPARPFLAAALMLADKEVDLSPAETKRRDKLIADFEANRSLSKPISFYNWTPELLRVWRFFQFLQKEFPEDDLAVPRAIAAVLKNDQDLLKQYRAVNAFYGRLTNPMICMPVDALIGADKSLDALAKDKEARNATIAIFPPSTSRETELFEQIFPEGVPGHVNLMTELIKRIRSGKVDLAPDDNAGWYQYQVYALQTMLLPGKVQESEKLLLTANYKRRLVEAFKSLVTKRRETHSRHAKKAESKAAAPLGRAEVRPRLRVEPSLTFYLRTARAYGFLQNFLLATVGRERLSILHGLRKGGQRQMTLHDELEAIKQRFYGFYLVGCEDIGMRPKFLADEPVDQKAAKQAAIDWLESIPIDPDLACDTRVSVPIYLDPISRKTRLWGTLGIRLAHLEASYARWPKIRPEDQSGDWQDVKMRQLGNSRFVIPVDEFAEFEIGGLNSLTREEFRNICDRHKTKENMIQALSSPSID